MMHIKMVINTDNAAFEDNGKETEVKNIISKFFSTIKLNKSWYEVLHDSNGNTVGTITITEN